MTEMPELRLLRIALGQSSLARRLAQAPGGWRTLSQVELDGLGLTKTDQRRVTAMQTLTRRSNPELKRHSRAVLVTIAITTDEPDWVFADYACSVRLLRHRIRGKS
jgi:hypothetical protein